MLSLWPNLFDFWFVAPALLRLALGTSLLTLYYPVWRSGRGIFGLLAGGLTLVGLFIQPAVLVAALLLVGEIWSKRQPWLTLFPLIAIALSLLVLGPGLFAFDLPL